MQSKKELIKALRELPEKIKQAETEILSNNERLQELSLIMKSMEHSVSSLVNDEVGEDGKPVYKNKDAREAETSLRLDKNAQFILKRSEYTNLKKKLSLDEIDIAFMRRTFRALEVLGLLLAEGAIEGEDLKGE